MASSAKAFVLRLCLAALGTAFASPVLAASYYTQKPVDAAAIDIAPSGGDDTAMLQAAIDRAQARGQGIVLLAPGRYRVGNTINVWPSIRLIGYGAARPVLELTANAAGFNDAAHEKIMIYFAGGRPRNPGDAVPDANPGTFYSAISNVDVEIGAGNTGAVAVRAHYAQHCFLAHMDFNLGPALAAVHEGGNVIEDVRFIGGKYGIWTARPSPGWQLTVIDSHFEGQRDAAIFEREAGLTLIRAVIRNVPTAVRIEDGRIEEMWVSDTRLEDIAGPAFVISAENNPRTQINMESVTARNVPLFAQLGESGKRFEAPGANYTLRSFSHGLHYANAGRPPFARTIFDATAVAALPRAPASDILPLPAQQTWVNVRDLGAKGDGATDDTAVLRAAIAGHKTLYFPSGFYVVRDTLTLKPDTVLIGLHPGATQIIVPDGSPAFAGPGAPRALLETPRGGTNIVIGIGLYTSGNNPRAVAALWRAGTNSMMNDVRFLGGHGTPLPDGGRERPYNDTHTADPNPARHWDSQYPSLWVTDGGGGTFLDLWTPSTFAQAGMMVSDTQTEGRVYQVSSEHHVRNEIVLRNVQHWRFHAMQTEEERGESGAALPVDIQGSNDILFANYLCYRVISLFQPYPDTVRVSGSTDIRFRNFHCYSNSKASFDNAVTETYYGVSVREREFAVLDITGDAMPPPSTRVPRVADGALEKLAGGFYNISGGAAAANGDFYFVDAHWQRILKWDSKLRLLSTVSEFPIEPVNLAVDASGNLVVISYTGNGTVYAVNAANGRAVQLAQGGNARGKTFYLPVGDYRIARDAFSAVGGAFVSPDGSIALPVTAGFLQGQVSYGVKSSPQIRAYGLTPVKPGQTHYVTEEASLQTWAADVGADGALSNFRLFAEQGGESVAVDAAGNVYIAAGQIYVYDPAGKLIDTIETPERPIQIVFGGPDRRTLFIATRATLYAQRMKNPGR